jgi:hypothetical protein
VRERLLLVLEFRNRIFDFIDVLILLVHLLLQCLLLFLNLLELAVDVADALKQLSFLLLRLLVIVNLRVHGLFPGQLRSSHASTLLDFGLFLLQMLALLPDFLNFYVDLAQLSIQIFFLRLLESGFLCWQCRDLGLSSEHHFLVLLWVAVVELVLPRVHILIVMLLVTLVLLTATSALSVAIVAFAFFVVLLSVLPMMFAIFALLCGLWAGLVHWLVFTFILRAPLAVLACSLWSILFGLLFVRFLLFVAHLK